MQPTCVEILQSCVANLEELVLPHLQEDPMARSAGHCIHMLLNHVILRLEQEGQAWSAENAEKRRVLAGIADGLRPKAPELAAEIERDVANVPAQAPFVPVEALSAENYALKEITAWVLERLHELSGPQATAALSALRRNIRADLDREMAMIRPAIPTAASGPAFF